MDMRELALQRIAELPNKESDGGRYMRVKRHMYIMHYGELPTKRADKTVRESCNLDTFRYDLMSNEMLLEIYACLLAAQAVQR